MDYAFKMELSPEMRELLREINRQAESLAHNTEPDNKLNWINGHIHARELELITGRMKWLAEKSAELKREIAKQLQESFAFMVD
jgi:hypothetical protein